MNQKIHDNKAGAVTHELNEVAWMGPVKNELPNLHIKTFDYIIVS